MCNNVENVASFRINDRKTMNPVVEQGSNRVEKTGIRADGNKVLYLVKDIWKINR